jgi:hypothetical protein
MTEPITPPAGDLEDVQTAWGTMPRWKARALALAEMQTVIREIARNDGVEYTLLRDEDKPPPLATDEASTSRATLSDEELKMIEDAVDALDARLTKLEARRDAERKLLELEEALEKAGIAPEEEGQPIKLEV